MTAVDCNPATKFKGDLCKNNLNLRSDSNKMYICFFDCSVCFNALLIR